MLRLRRSEVAVAELPQEEKERLKKAIVDRGPTHARQALQWVQELNRTAGDLSRRGEAAGVDVMSTFWIKLYGVLDEIGGSYAFFVKYCEDIGAGASKMAIDARTMRDAIVAVRDSMSEDELIWLSYRRDVECHVWQDSYELNKRGDKLKERRGFSLLGDKVLHVDDFDQRASAFIRKHNVDEKAIAVHFAKLVAPHAARVLELLLPMHEPDR
jgi:hypothetical protein